MHVYHIRCSSSACSGNPKEPKHCRANIVVHHRKPIVLPKQGEALSEETRSQLIALLPNLCPEAHPDCCTFQVATDRGFDRDVEYLYDSLLDTDNVAVTDDAARWMEGIVRSPEPVADVVTTALRERSNDDVLALIVEGRNRLWETEHTYSLN